METRKALFVGINDYPQSPLYGCVPDAENMHRLLVQHAKGDPNFESHLVVSGAGKQHISKKFLEGKLKQVFAKTCDMALFYFSGHGTLIHNKFCLVAQDRYTIDFDWLTDLLNQSKHKEILVILDCCFSGGAAEQAGESFSSSTLREGVTILAATTSDDVAAERMGAGRFTSLLCRGLEGAAADLFGHVTPANLYAYADTFLGMWEQRPVFKANVKRMTPIRYCVPPVRKRYLRQLPAWFPTQHHQLPLGLQHDLCHPQHDPDSAALLTVLLLMERQGLVIPHQQPSLIEETRHAGAARLSEKGKEIWALAKAHKI